MGSTADSAKRTLTAAPRPSQSDQQFRPGRLSLVSGRIPGRFGVNDLPGRNPCCRPDGLHLLAPCGGY